MGRRLFRREQNSDWRRIWFGVPFIETAFLIDRGLVYLGKSYNYLMGRNLSLRKLEDNTTLGALSRREKIVIAC